MKCCKRKTDARAHARIGALMAQAADDPTSPVRVAAFAQGLQELGWLVGSNVWIDYRWATSDADRAHYAAEFNMHASASPNRTRESGKNQEE